MRLAPACRALSRRRCLTGGAHEDSRHTEDIQGGHEYLGRVQARFEYIEHAVIRMNGASIALYRKRLRATLCMTNPHTPAHSAMTMYSNASCASDRTFAR